MSVQSEEEKTYFRAVGMIVTIASNCDLVMFNTFRVLTGLPAGIASSIYYVLDSLKPKEKMLTEIVRQTCNAEQAALVSTIIRSTLSANTKRIEVAHAAKLVLPDGSMHRATPRRHKQPTKPLSGHEVTQMTVECDNYYKTALASFKALCGKRGVPPEIKISRLRDAIQSDSRTPSTPDRQQEEHPPPPQEPPESE